MIWFWLIAGLLILVVLLALLRPLVRGAPISADPSEPVAEIYRQQLANIDAEVAQGRVSAEQAADARAGIVRRMLAAADQKSRDLAVTDGNPGEASRRIGAALAIAALMPLAALAIYAAVGAPSAIDQARTVAAAERTAPRDKAEFSAAADQLKARLQREPGHREGWVLLGRALTSLGRFSEAKEAYLQAIALTPQEPALHAELGEFLVVAAGGAVTPEAEAEFARSGNDPRARFYGAEAALQRGDTATAKAGLKALLADAPADAPWRNAVAERLSEISPADSQASAGPSSPAPNTPAAGPTAKDVAAAQAMSPEERQAMIRGMVDRLAARLEQSPNDKEGWARLAHAYDVLGEKEKAQAARLRAASVAAPPEAPAAQPVSPAK
jgi:cytochrome c-type biogenesis protein CcmH